jgi:hypothetical protein
MKMLKMRLSAGERNRRAEGGERQVRSENTTAASQNFSR